MHKFKTNSIDKMTSPFGRYFVVCALVIIMIACATILVLFRTNTVLNVDTLVSDSMITKVQPTTTSVSVIKSIIEDEQSSAYSTPIGSGEVGSFDQSIYDKFIAAGYDEEKSLAITYAWCTFSGKYSPEFAIGLMANILSEGSAGAVEQAFSIKHAHGFSLPSGKAFVQDAADVEYLKAWDSKSKTKDKGVQKGSCGFGMAQMSFDRRVRLCDAYLAHVSDYKDKHQLATAEIAYIDSEVATGGHFDNVPKACEGKSYEECAKIICLKFEMPASPQTQAVIRANKVAKLKQTLGLN